MFLNDLNSQQKNITTTQEKVVVVKAGPGTGKTKTLTSRIAYLLEQGVDNEKILAVTFTKKAALEMRERLSKMVITPLPMITTFHGFCLELLDNEIKIVSEKNRVVIIANIAKANNISPRKLSLLISQWKSNPASEKPELVVAYDKALSDRGVVDYDDILLHAYDKLKSTKAPLFEYLFVDEFQDTNPIQYEIIKLLMYQQEIPHLTYPCQFNTLSGRVELQASSSVRFPFAKEGGTQILTPPLVLRGRQGGGLQKVSLFVIGDPNQSIYSFRGANPHVFDDLQRDYADAKVFTLDTNYRSSPSITAVSNTLFSDTNLSSHRQDTGNVLLITTMHEFSEADYIINEINKTIGGLDLISASHLNNSRHSERSHVPAGTRRSVESLADSEITSNTGFSNFAIIYRTHSLIKILEDKLLASGIPFQVIGNDSVFADMRVKTMYQILLAITDFATLDLPPIEIDQIKELDFTQKLSKVIEHLITILGYEKDITIHQFIGNTLHFDKYDNGLKRFIEYYSYLELNDFYDARADKVTLMTIHAAKGLEFNTLFIPALEQGIIPLMRDADTIEEKRLFYVGITRAKDNLYLIQSKSRNKKQTTPSEFLKIIRIPELVEIEDDANIKIEKKREIAKKKKAQISLF